MLQITAPNWGVWSKKAVEQVTDNFELHGTPKKLAENLESHILNNELVLLPLQNIYGGNVTDTLRSLASLDGILDLEVYDVIKQNIQHTLCWLPGQEIENIKTIYSHPQAIFQCAWKIQINWITAVKVWWTAEKIWNIWVWEWLILDYETAVNNGYRVYDTDFWPDDNFTYFIVVWKKWLSYKSKKHNNDGIKIGMIPVEDFAGSLLLQVLPLLQSWVNFRQITAVSQKDGTQHIGVVLQQKDLNKKKELLQNTRSLQENILQLVDNTLSENYEISFSQWKISLQDKPGALAYLLMYCKYFSINLHSLESQLEWDRVVFQTDAWSFSIIENSKDQISPEIQKFVLQNIWNIKQMKLL